MKSIYFTILFGVLLAVGLFILRQIDYHFVILHDHKLLYGGIIAVIFLGMGFLFAKKISNKPSQNTTHEKSDHPLLSPREHEILNLIELGKTNQEIADSLFVSVNTVKTHVKNIFEKLQVKSRAQAVATVKNSQNHEKND